MSTCRSSCQSFTFINMRFVVKVIFFPVKFYKKIYFQGKYIKEYYFFIFTLRYVSFKGTLMQI